MMLKPFLADNTDYPVVFDFVWPWHLHRRPYHEELRNTVHFSRV